MNALKKGTYTWYYLPVKMHFFSNMSGYNLILKMVIKISFPRQLAILVCIYKCTSLYSFMVFNFKVWTCYLRILKENFLLLYSSTAGPLITLSFSNLKFSLTQFFRFILYWILLKIPPVTRFCKVSSCCPKYFEIEVHTWQKRTYPY